VSRAASPSSRWAIVAGVGLAIAVASLWPAPAGAGLEGGYLVGVDKYLHFLGYFGLGAVVAAVDGRRSPSRVLVATALAAAAYGAGIELLQHPIPGRTPDGADALANVLGATTGATLGTVVSRGRVGTERD